MGDSLLRACGGCCGCCGRVSCATDRLTPDHPDCNPEDQRKRKTNEPEEDRWIHVDRKRTALHEEIVERTEHNNIDGQNDEQ